MSSSAVDAAVGANEDSAKQQAGADRSAASVGAAAVGSPVGNEFNYRPVPMLAPVSVGIGLLSFASFISVAGALVGLVGVFVAVACLWQISRSDGELGGRTVATIGLVLCGGVPVCGLSFQYYEYRQELPEGYQRVNFVRDISERKFILRDGQRELHPEVAPLDGQKIFIKGFMYQSQSLSGLKRFVLLKDNGECCFGGEPKPYDMIDVSMVPGRTVDSVDGLVAVGGVLKANADALPGEAVYTLECDYFAKARTVF